MEGWKGPIPARAGEPLPCLVVRDGTGAYPRSRGGTMIGGAPVEVVMGLSPLARGNLFRQSFPLIDTGPIPARAGEPRGLRANAAGVGAYPRSRGGTVSMTR